MPSSDESYALIRPFVTDELMEAYYSSIKHHGTDDLVLILDVELDELKAFVRDKAEVILRRALAEDKSLADMITVPARETIVALKGFPAFWFIVLFKDQRTVCVSISGTLVSGGGDA